MKDSLFLNEKDKKTLEEAVRKGKTEQRMVLRARIILHLSDGMSPKKIADELNITVKTVKKWRHRFLKKGIDGLYDLPRSGKPPKFTIQQRLEVIAIACDSPENYGIEGYTQWTLDCLTEAVGKEVEGPKMSRTSIHRTLDEIDLKPHKKQMWLHSKDPQFKEKTNAIVSLYLEPPEDTEILCVDEKSGIQAKERKYETKHALPGKPGKYEHEYIRHGTQALLASFNIKTGEVIAECSDTRKAQDLIDFMETVAAHYEHSKKIIIIWDNLNIHYDGTSKRWTEFNKRHDDKFQFIYTPIHASWVNQIEIFFSILQKRCLKYGNFHSIEDLKRKILAFINRWNTRDGHPFNWTFQGYPLQNKKKEKEAA